MKTYSNCLAIRSKGLTQKSVGLVENDNHYVVVQAFIEEFYRINNLGNYNYLHKMRDIKGDEKDEEFVGNSPFSNNFVIFNELIAIQGLIPLFLVPKFIDEEPQYFKVFVFPHD